MRTLLGGCAAALLLVGCVVPLEAADDANSPRTAGVGRVSPEPELFDPTVQPDAEPGDAPCCPDEPKRRLPGKVPRRLSRLPELPPLPLLLWRGGSPLLPGGCQDPRPADLGGRQYGGHLSVNWRHGQRFRPGVAGDVQRAALQRDGRGIHLLRSLSRCRGRHGQAGHDELPDFPQQPGRKCLRQSGPYCVRLFIAGEQFRAELPLLLLLQPLWLLRRLRQACLRSARLCEHRVVCRHTLHQHQRFAEHRRRSPRSRRHRERQLRYSSQQPPVGRAGRRIACVAPSTVLAGN